MTTHLLRHITTHRGADVSAWAWCAERRDDLMVTEAALADCRECLSARADALHFQSGSIPGSLAKGGPDRPIVSATSPGGADGARGPGDTGRDSRGARAITLLKELNMVRIHRTWTLELEHTSIWEEVRKLLAEEMPGMTP